MSFNRVPNDQCGLVAAVGFLCLCVLAQILGVPGTAVDLFTSSDMLVGSGTIDVSLTSARPEPQAKDIIRRHALAVAPPVRLPCVVTSVFHPPLA